MQKIFLIATLMIFSFGCVSASKHKELEKNHKELSDKHNYLEGKAKEQEELILQLKNKLGLATSDIENMREALSELRDKKAKTEKRLKEYREITAKFQRMVDAGQLKVKIVDGRMVVELPSDVLFSSGSSKLSAEGTKSLQTVAGLLKTIDRHYQVEGHTDNVPIRSQSFYSNWELASARAINVVKTMTEAGLPSSKISAASFGEFKPVASNETKEGKAANRRIEIVILPDLSALPGHEELEKLGQ